MLCCKISYRISNLLSLLRIRIYYCNSNYSCIICISCRNLFHKAFISFIQIKLFNNTFYNITACNKLFIILRKSC